MSMATAAVPSAAMELGSLIGAPTASVRVLFPLWHALLVAPSRECKSAEWLARVHMHVYLPMFSKKICRRGQKNGRRQCAALPGMLFVPREMMDIPRRDEMLDQAQARLLRTAPGAPPITIRKSDIELIRLLEAKLNLPPEAKGVLLKTGERVRFRDGSLWQWWVGGVIFEIVDETRIGVEVPGLFGRATRVYVPESEIEAM